MIEKATLQSRILNISMDVEYDNEKQTYTVQVPSRNVLIPTRKYTFNHKDMQALTFLLQLAESNS